MKQLRNEIENHINDLYAKLRKLLKARVDTNITNDGQIKIDIDFLYDKIKEAQDQLNELNTLDGPSENDEFNIFVFSAKRERVVNFISQEKYRLIEPPLHGDTIEEWIPFTTESYTIEEILKEIENKGYSFKTFYLEGEPSEEETLQTFIKNSKNNILIIDLLSIDEQNKSLTGRIDQATARAIITPICRYLHADIQHLMAKIRVESFKYLTSDYKNPTMNCYHPDLSGYQTLTNTIQKFVSRSNTNEIIGGPKFKSSIRPSF